MNQAVLSMMAAVWIGSGAEAPPVSRDSMACIKCHEEVTPGIVADWRRSAHSAITVKDALARPPLARRVSAASVPEALAPFAVGCAECHCAQPEEHKDTWNHNAYQVHVVVTPRNCATCHPVEAGQYEKNLMSYAYGNLRNNPVFHSLEHASSGILHFDGKEITQKPPAEMTRLDACFACHGSAVEVKELATRDTAYGEMEFPVLTGWPNQGVGRINPDGSRGSCSACHTRHHFSIATARKPYTCSQCHKGPDVPAYPVYMVSKHGNLFSSQQGEWNFTNVPWRVGKDFTAPTCATCHVSLLTIGADEVIAERTHQMNDRSAWRLFGLPYAHPHPRSPDTTIIRNAAGLPLPTELTGEPVAEFLIDAKERDARRATMQEVCHACHGGGWIEGHFAKLEHTIEETNRQTLTATQLLLAAWKAGAARGPVQGDSLFNETIERKWTEVWLFYANSIRFSSAMGGADYGVFANGRWYLTRTIQEMHDMLPKAAPAKE